jgi:ABC-type antimicrobial peptide transport system permease subunit
MTAVRRTSSLAIVSLVAGLLGWTLAPWLGSIIAVITGHLARAEIRRDPTGVEGDGLAIAGLVLGWSMILLSLLTILVVVLFFGGLAALFAFAAGASA